MKLLKIIFLQSRVISCFFLTNLAYILHLVWETVFHTCITVSQIYLSDNLFSFYAENFKYFDIE